MLNRLSNEPVIFMFRKMWAFADGLKLQIIVMWVLAVIARLIWMSPPLIFAAFLNELQNNGVTHSNIYYLLGLLVAIFATDVSGWFFHGPSRVMERSIGYKIDRAYKKYLYNAVMSLPLAWHTDHDSGDTIDKVNKATNSVYDFAKSTFILVGILVRIIASTIVLAYFNIYISVIALIIMLIAIYVLIKFDEVIGPQYKELNIFDNKAQAKVYDALSNVTTIKVLSIEKPILEGIKNTWYASYDKYIHVYKLVEWKWFAGGAFFDFLVLAPVVFYVYYNFSMGNAILVGTVSALYMYLKDYTEVYYNIAGRYDEISIQKSRVYGVKEVEDTFAKLSKVKKKNFANWKNILIKNINFKYDENTDDNSLKIENLNIKKGEKIAIIGESGSGKSTLLKVIHGMYEKAIAEVEIDKKTIKTNFQNLNINSTLVPQEPEVFSASIKENITLLTNFTEQEIEKASRISEFHEVALELPKGYDSVVNEKGVNLSGGQKQRLALSRALLFSKDKEIILLDESTSSVDPINEVKIYKNIFENFPGVTVLASIHKMNLLKYFDRIIILEKGKIKEIGTFQYLLDNNEDFKQSWNEFVLSSSEVIS